MGYYSELHAEGPYRTCGEADEARRFYPEEYADVMTQVARFNNEWTARRYRDQGYEGRWIVLGDNNEYWVCSYRYARKLVEFGYEMLEG